MFKLPLLFIVTGIFSFLGFHVLSLFSLGSWMGEPPRNPEGWFRIHLMVLDWGTMIAMGAVYQLMDVVLQRKLYSRKLGYLHYICFLCGSSILLIGFLRLEVSLIAAGAILTWVGICLFAWNIGQTMRLAAKWNAITISTACAVGYLVLTGFLGIMMGIDFVHPIWGGIHDRLLSAHIWMGTIGWFGLLISGFSYKMLPMFYLSHGESAKRPSTIVVLWNSATLLGALHFLLGGWVYLGGIVIVLMLAALIIYEIHMRDIRKHRHKGTPGSGIRWTIYSTRGLIVYVVIFLSIWLVNPDIFENERILIVTGWMYLYGWVAMTILGYLSKIVPFLWWTHKYGPLAGKKKVPVMNDLINDQYVNYGMAGMCGGLLVLLLGIGINGMLLIWIGGCLLSVCSLLYMSLIVRVFAR
ncbi:hypothetical protein GK047_07665 [Paenibacillus sp. SYP-B3998]|uniref:Cbb3-type cytochrome c oxidase subunit I n=1 Tax=Paenibacillus sp. SYP-B3998 TaxID=2678564 RepID=A0A6G3ZWB9_9BACL|nr:hypothetical protein [Paenibacillus sp. SYP-B3998]NEW05889.1 hypothetical protein [Paenibacillus sp. SYP-B3998]